MTRSRPLIAAGTLAAVALLTACGSDDDDAADTISNPQVSLRESADAQDDDDQSDSDPSGEGVTTGEGDTVETDDRSATQETADPVASKEIAVVNSRDEGVALRVDVMSLERGAGDVVRMDLRVTNIDDDAGWTPYSTFSASVTNDLSGVSLVDLANDLRYLVLSDSDGECLCSSMGVLELAPGESVDAQASFPAPPAGVAEVDVHLGDLGVIGPVPLSDR